VIEDAACAVGSEVSLDSAKTWEPIGKPHGQAACFSFHPRKVITTGEGGMITSRNIDLDRQFRLVRHHGMDASNTGLENPGSAQAAFHAITGFNYKLTDLQAAIGVEQLKRLPEIIERRWKLAELYCELIDPIAGVRPPSVPPFARPNWQSFIVSLDDPKQQIRAMDELQKEGISSRTGIACAHTQPPYLEQCRDMRLPNSELAQKAGLLLPLYPAMKLSDVKRVVKTLARAMR
jgi:dTDP-4-amino-4,6-dideoxygalactose transaminase